MRMPLAAVALVACSLVVACSPAETPPEVEAEFVANAAGLDRRNMDLTVDACVDFYQYANGGWLARNSIPADQSSWGLGDELRERNYEILRTIMEESAAADAEIGTNRRRVGDFWATGMDTSAIEAAGLAPIEDLLAGVDDAEDLDDIAAMIPRMNDAGSMPLFSLGLAPDLMKSDQYMFYTVQGGLGLPDRDYYTREDEESVSLRDDYVAHVARMLGTLGYADEAAADAAQAILHIETRLASASLTPVEMRNPANFYNVISIADAEAVTPNFSWSDYFSAIGLADMEVVSQGPTAFFEELNTVLVDVPVGTWKDYLRWNIINRSAPYLSETFADADFEFYRKRLRGAEQQRPRWKRVVDVTSAGLGEAVGEVYVERAFTPETKARAEAMIANLRAAVRMRLENLEWMSDETKARALEKLDAFVWKIGYPDEWRDYSELEIRADSYLGNVRAATAFEMVRNVAKIGEPIDRNEWSMSPQTVNAYYNPTMTEIVFPAAILQPPSFDGAIDDAVNYGAMGAVIGHEFMHGFDDQGSRFDAQGNMVNWWTDEDRARFEERTAKLVEQFNGFVAVGDLHVNGALTLGENIGDLAGLTMSYYALQEALEENHPGEIDGFTPEQRFFLSWAQFWRRNARDEATRLQVNTDPHSPSKFRTNGPLANMPEFASAFGCSVGDPMVLADDVRAEIW